MMRLAIYTTALGLVTVIAACVDSVPADDSPPASVSSQEEELLGPPAIDDQCKAAVTCILNLCVTLGAKPDGTACDDANACTIADHCQAGACVGGGPRDCSDGVACTVDTCAAATGCSHQRTESCESACPGRCYINTDCAAWCNDGNPPPSGAYCCDVSANSCYLSGSACPIN